MKGSIADKERLAHILDAIHEIEEYTSGVDFEEFMSKSIIRFACIKQLEIIGEAANHISASTKSLSPIEWSKIVSLRNILIHEYFGVLNHIIWQVIATDIPILKEQIQALFLLV